MAIVIKTKNKQQEKAIKAFLDENDIDYSKVEEEPAIYKTRQKKNLTKKEKIILQGLEESVDFVNKHKKGKVKAKSLKQLLDEL
jgi:transcriptional regulator CtsR